MKRKIISLCLSIILSFSMIVSLASCSFFDKVKQKVCTHEYGASEIVKESTCSSFGIELSTCKLCGKTKETQIAKVPHKELIVEAKSSTCTEKGHSDYVICSVCNEIIVAPIELPILEHNVVIDELVNPGCLTTGLTEGSHCQRCGEILLAQEVIPAIGHNVVEVKGYEATCTKVGKTTGRECSTCGEVFIKQEDIPTTEHNVVNDVCTVCGLSFSSLYLNYIETPITSDTKAAGNIFRIYKNTEGSSYDGNFLMINKSFEAQVPNFELAPDGIYRTNVIFIGVLNNGKFVASFEPMVEGYGQVELTPDNTTIKVYESYDYYDIVINDGDTICFDGSLFHTYPVEGTFIFDYMPTVDNFSGKVYLLTSPETEVLD